jgi:glycosyltransferase involved in cell wall biosynthesis
MSREIRKHKIRTIVCWGTAGNSNARTVILLDGLKMNGVQLIDCRLNIWKGVRDRSNVKSPWVRLVIAARWLAAMPFLAIRYLFCPDHDLVLVNYPGHMDMPWARLVARIRGKPVVWDAFISAWDTIVCDRKLVAPGSLVAQLAFKLDQVAASSASAVLLDTGPHRDYFVNTFNLAAEKCLVTHVGAPAASFPASVRHRRQEGPLEILFYGTLIPLHGLATILKAIRLLQDEAINWTLVGSGQEQHLMDTFMADMSGSNNVRWLEWVPFSELSELIKASDVCLGVFSDSDKASRVIPNKLFQCLSSNRPVITQETEAISELDEDLRQLVFTVPPADPEALAGLIQKMAVSTDLFNAGQAALSTLHEGAIGHFFLQQVTRLLEKPGTAAGKRKNRGQNASLSE